MVGAFGKLLKKKFINNALFSSKSPLLSRERGFFVACIFLQKIKYNPGTSSFDLPSEDQNQGSVAVLLKPYVLNCPSTGSSFGSPMLKNNLNDCFVLKL